VASAQIVDALARYTPSEAPVLRQIHAEYLKEARGESSEVDRYMHWAGRYALMLKEELFSAGSVRGQLPKVARTQLTISVTIVTRNRAPLLKMALQSLVAQERKPDQVVVVDNASTDETREVALSFADRLRISVVSETRVGIPIARNTAIKHCTGDIVALLDDDCVADRRWLAEIEQPFLRDPHIAAVGGKLTPVEGQVGLIARFYDTRMRDVVAAEGLNDR
jgi:cellulose synthase/poly-beta-1,6-N-acetylglucosamine synthase-like glycosyltransferase